MRAASAAAWLGIVLALVCGARVSTHRLHELLQAARLDIQPARLELQIDLTPGAEAADALIAELDSNRDGALSSVEQQRYAAAVLDGVDVVLDGRALGMQLLSVSAAEVGTFRRGSGAICVRAAANLPAAADGDHRLMFRNRFRPESSAYLANALTPLTDTVVVTSQRRDADQRTLTIDYTLRAAPAEWWWR